jgi:hypothetical protein
MLASTEYYRTYEQTAKEVKDRRETDQHYSRYAKYTLTPPPLIPPHPLLTTYSSPPS